MLLYCMIMFVVAGSEEQASVLQSRITELELQLEQAERGVALQAELDSLKTENEKLRAKVGGFWLCQGGAVDRHVSL